MNNKSEIILSGSELEPGETTRIVCPTCGGGNSQEVSLVITRGEDGHLVWVCHRATCPTKGGSGFNGSVPATITKKKQRKKFTGTTEPLSDSLRDTLFDMWGITTFSHWYWTSFAGGRLAMSIRSPKYMHRGWVLRDIRGRSAIKALTYLDEGEESLSWYKVNTSAPTVVVEDIPSAVRVSMCGVNAVSLLGTGAGIGKANEIAEHAPRPIIVALDQDATSQTFKMVQRYALLWDNPQVMMLKRDIKDLDKRELEELLGGDDA